MPPRPVPAGPLMTQERLMFSNPTPSELHRSLTSTMSDDMPCCRLPPHPCPAPLSCILTLSLLSLRPSLIQFVSIVSLHSPSLRLGLRAPQPSRRHHAQSLLGPSSHDPRTHHVLESHPEQAATMSDDTPSALTPSLHCISILQPAAPSQVVAFES